MQSRKIHEIYPHHRLYSKEVQSQQFIGRSSKWKKLLFVQSVSQSSTSRKSSRKTQEERERLVGVLIFGNLSLERDVGSKLKERNRPLTSVLAIKSRPRETITPISVKLTKENGDKNHPADKMTGKFFRNWSTIGKKLSTCYSVIQRLRFCDWRRLFKRLIERQRPCKKQPNW